MLETSRLLLRQLREPTSERNKTMTIDDMITKLQKLREQHGNIDVLLVGDDRTPCGVCSVFHTKLDGDYFPENWNMPMGTEYITIST